MKRCLAVICALVLALSCAAVATADAPALEPAELKVWVIGTVDQKDSDTVWEAYNAKLQETLPNTTVDFYVPTDYSTAFNMASGEQIDLAWSGYCTALINDAKEGTLLPLDELVRTYGQGIIDTLTLDVIDQHRLMDGKLYQIPSYQGLCGKVTACFPMEVVNLMREGWMEDMDAALTAKTNAITDDEKLTALTNYIAVFEEFVDTAYANDKLGMFMMPGSIIAYMGINPCNTSTFDNGGMYFQMKNDDSFQLVNPFDTDSLWYRSAKIVYAKMAEWYTKGYIPADVISLSENNGYQRWEGEIAADRECLGYTGCNITLEETAKSFAKSVKSDVVLFGTRRVWYSELGNATGMSIPYTSKNPERAMMLVNEMYVNPELYQIWVYGIKDVHYTEKEDGSIVTLGGDGQATSDWSYGQWKWTFGNCLLSRQTQTDATDPVAVLNYDMENLKNCYVRPFLSWSFDNTNVQTQQSNVNVIWEEASQQLAFGIHGDNWETVFDKYVAEVQAAGEADIVAEAQKQIDAYVAASGITSLNEDHLRSLPQESYAIGRYVPEAE